MASIFLATFILVGIFGGNQNDVKIRDSYIVQCFLEIFIAQKFGMEFLGVKCWSRIFLGFDFCPHSIIPVT